MAYAWLRKRKVKKPAAETTAAAEPGDKPKPKRKKPLKKQVYWIGYTDRHGDPQQIASPSRHTDYPLALAEAVRIEQEERAIRNGARHVVSASGVTFGVIAERFIKIVLASQESLEIDEGRLRNHVLPQFGERLANGILPTEIDEHLQALQHPKLMLKLSNPPPGEGKPPFVRRVQSAKSAHNIRCLMSGAYEYARTGMQMEDLRNPVTASRAIDYQKKRPTPIPLEWVEPLLTNLPRHYFALFVTALFTGFRKGELGGMKVKDLNLDTGVLTCRGTWGKQTNKSKEDRPVPLSDRLIPLLRNTVAGRSPEAPLFEMPDTGRISRKTGKPIGARAFRKDVKLPDIMRSALIRAGIGGGGFTVVCKRGASTGRLGRHEKVSWGCKYRGTREVETPGEQCPECEKGRLWFSVIPVENSFKDLRSTFATWLARTAGDIRAATILLGHSSVKVTEDSYAELVAEQLRPEVNKLPFAPELLLQAAVGDTSPETPPEGPDTSLTSAESEASSELSAAEISLLDQSTAVRARQGMILQPLGSKPKGIRPEPESRNWQGGAGGSSPEQRRGVQRQPPHRPVAGGSNPQHSRPDASLTPLRPKLTVIAGGGERLLTPQQVARFLGVHPSTVHQAITRGDFGEVLRFGSSFVRIRASNLEAFLQRSANPNPRGKP